LYIQDGQAVKESPQEAGAHSTLSGTHSTIQKTSQQEQDSTFQMKLQREVKQTSRTKKPSQMTYSVYQISEHMTIS
jgi:hypothetical protein